MAVKEDPIAQALEVSFERKDHLGKIFVNLEVQKER